MVLSLQLGVFVHVGPILERVDGSHRLVDMLDQFGFMMELAFGECYFAFVKCKLSILKTKLGLLLPIQGCGTI